jgi:zinc transport system substrate-binding protein
MNFGDSDKFGDSALNCHGSYLSACGVFAKQLSALSPNLSKFIAAALLFTSTALAHAEAPKAVASFKPIHSLVAAVMRGVGAPYLMVKGAASPHTYAMTPSDAQALQSADAVFWVGPEMEAFLAKPLEALGGKAEIVTLDAAEGLTKLPPREGGAFDGHADEGEAEHEEFDAHIWLDPQNAKIIVRGIEKALSGKDPANAAAYKANAGKTSAALDALDAELSALLAPVKDKSFITFHDAFQYFEIRFGLRAAGSISVNPDIAPSAARIAELQAKVRQTGAVCVFSEPNFAPEIVSVVIEGTDARTAAVDPEASALTEGPELYFQSLREIAAAMRTCLER